MEARGLLFSINKMKHTNLASLYSHACLHTYIFSLCMVLEMHALEINILLLTNLAWLHSLPTSLVLNLVILLMDDFTRLSLWLLTCKTEWCGKAMKLLQKWFSKLKYDYQFILHSEGWSPIICSRNMRLLFSMWDFLLCSALWYICYMLCFPSQFSVESMQMQSQHFEKGLSTFMPSFYY
jgi:hypothetical protein